MNRAAAAIFLATSLLVLTGCPKRPLDFGPSGRIEDPEALLALVVKAEAQVETLRGEGRLRVESPQGSGPVNVSVAIARPGLLSLQTTDFINRPMAALVADGSSFQLYVVEENRFYRGPASPPNVSRFLPVVLPAEELVAVMLGEAPRIPHASAALTVDDDKRAYKLVLTQGGVTQTLWVHPTRHRVLESQVRGVDAYDLTFEDFTDAGPAYFPRTVTLVAARASTRVELRYAQVTLNAAPDTAAFTLEPPEGARVVEVDAAGRELPPAPPGS